MSEYTETVIDHFENPRNCGTMTNPDGTGEIGDPSCGDFLKVFIRVENNIITDIKYQIKGCPASIACASIMTELATCKDLDEAMMIENEDIVKALGGLPEHKLHCSNLGASGLQEAIINHVYTYVKR
jgi:nitrogen fixation NifU-like protein